jgi:insertion element IS1 protein InsB
VAFHRVKKNKLWVWKAYCRDTGELVDWGCGDRSAETLKKRLGRLKRFRIKVYFTDHWEAYAQIIPAGLLVQTKAQTHTIERNNARQRHGCG